MKTPVFTETSVPNGLLKNHNTAKNVWGMIRIVEGSLLYKIIEPEFEEIPLTPELHGVVEPQMLHQVEMIGPVKFFVEFYRDKPIEN